MTPRRPNTGELDEGAVSLLEKMPTRLIDPRWHGTEKLYVHIARPKNADLRETSKTFVNGA
jgi:hypothetical protein